MQHSRTTLNSLSLTPRPLEMGDGGGRQFARLIA